LARLDGPTARPTKLGGSRPLGPSFSWRDSPHATAGPHRPYDALYIGDQEAWGRYQRERILLQLGDKELLDSLNWEAGPREP